MSGHATAESLSLYLDAALSAAERRRVEDHLHGCPECRQRLDGLRRVVAGLGRLPTAAPPEDLAARVAREIDLRGRRRRWGGLVEAGLPRPLLGSPPMHLLALVLALGAIIYLFAHGLEMRRERPTRIVLPGADTVVVEPPPPDAAPAASGYRHLLGGRFRRAGDVWAEEGLEGRAPDSRVTLDAGDAGADAVPEVAELAALGGPVRMRVGSEIVEITFERVAAMSRSLESLPETGGKG